MRADWRNGQLCALIGNMFGGKTKPSDFMWKDEERGSDLTIEEASRRSEEQCMAVAWMIGAHPVERKANGSQS